MSERAEIEAFGLQTGTDGGIVRRAIISDVPAIMRLLRQVLSVHNASRPDLFKPEGGKYSEKENARYSSSLTPGAKCSGTVFAS